MPNSHAAMLSILPRRAGAADCRDLAEAERTRRRAKRSRRILKPCCEAVHRLVEGRPRHQEEAAHRVADVGVAPRLTRVQRLIAWRLRSVRRWCAGW